MLERGRSSHERSCSGRDDDGPGPNSTSDGYKDRIIGLIKAKTKGEVAQVKEKRPKNPIAKNMMEVLREMAESSK